MTTSLLKKNEMTTSFTSELLLRLLREEAKTFFQSVPKSITSLVLTGSISRGEGSFIADPLGGAELIGDIEFLLVSNDLSEGRRKAMELERVFSSMLRDRNIRAIVDVTAAQPSYFEALSPLIFTVELKEHGTVIAGDASIMEQIPDFQASDIPALDALHLLFNRMVEQMIALDGLFDGTLDGLKRAHYQNLKFTLDIGGSMLAAMGRYKTTYAERAEAMEAALTELKDEPIGIELSNLGVEVSKATVIKLNPELDPLLSLDADSKVTEELTQGVLARWLELASTSKSLWLWEMKLYLGGDCLLDVDDLLTRYCKKEKAAARLYGWSKCIGRLRRKGEVYYGRLFRLANSGSPRGHIYASAARLYFALPAILDDSGQDLSEVETQKILRELPSLIDENGSWTGVCENVIHNWNMHVKTNE
jgi:hypothetical protein